MPKGSDTAYLSNLHGDFEGHASFVKGNDRRHWESEFGIRHYAGCVSYTVKGFVDKNRDVQQDVLFDFMSRSKNCFVQELASYQVNLITPPPLPNPKFNCICVCRIYYQFNNKVKLV